MLRHLGLRLWFLLAISIFFLINTSITRAQAIPRVTQTVDSSHRVTLEGNIHPLARAEFERGAVGAGQPIPRMLLLMKRSEAQQAALLTLMEQQQDKSSANYHAWLTPQDFGARFGPAEADIQTVTDWLTSQGFSVDKVYSGRHEWWFISFVCGFLALFLASMPRRRKYYRSVLSSVLIGVLAFALGCGGGGGGGGGGVAQAVTTTTLTVDNSKIGPGMSATLTATVTSSKALTGSVTFYQDAFPISQTIPLVAGKATFVLPYNGVGIFPYSAKYNGDTQNLTSSSSRLNEVYTGSTQVYLQGQTSTLTHQTTVTLNLQ